MLGQIFHIVWGMMFLFSQQQYKSSKDNDIDVIEI